MVELGDLVVFTPDEESYRGIGRFQALAEYKRLKQKISCGIVVSKKSTSEGLSSLRILFPEGNFRMTDDQVTAISKWYITRRKEM